MSPRERPDAGSGAVSATGSRSRRARRLVVIASVGSLIVCGSVAGAAALDRPATAVHEEIVVNAPRPVVWRLLTRFAEYREWNPYIVRASGAAESGSVLVLDRSGATGAITCEVITVRKGRKLYWRCRDHRVPGLLDREHTFRLLPTGRESETQVVYDGRWEGILVPFVDLDERKSGYLRMLEALKREAERLRQR